jgi:FtsH-binding integral membrane protein
MDMQLDYRVASQARAPERVAFIRRTYAHLAGAILAFAAIEAFLFNYAPASVVDTIVGSMLGSRFSWLLVLGAFMLVSWIATRWAQSDSSVGLQYLGLTLYVVAEAVLFVPLLFMAQHFTLPEDHVVAKAGIMTLAMFGGLTLAVFVSGKDFSFLRTYLAVGSLLAFGFIVASILFHFEGMLMLVFCFAMVALASGYIIFQTSNVIHQFRTDQHVAAALALFAAVALLFWYILQIVRLRSRR